MTHFTWKEPTANRRPYRKHDWNSIAQMLKDNPNEWAVVAKECSHAYATNIKRGKIDAFAPEGAYEATTRGNTNGRADELYVRFVGVK